jgi:hypothetical protein
MAAFWYRRAWENMLGGSGAAEARQTDFLSDTLKVMLTTSAYALNLDTNEVKADVTSEITGTLYTAGGTTIGTKVVATTLANSWSPAWAATTGYLVGDIIKTVAGNGKLYVAITAGTTGGSEPTWTTVLYDEQPADGTVTWSCIGSSITILDSADPSWGPGATFSGVRYAVLYNDTPADKPLLWVHDFVTDQAVNSGTFTITLPTTGYNHLFVP